MPLIPSSDFSYINLDNVSWVDVTDIQKRAPKFYIDSESGFHIDMAGIGHTKETIFSFLKNANFIKLQRIDINDNILFINKAKLTLLTISDTHGSTLHGPIRVGIKILCPSGYIGMSCWFAGTLVELHKALEFHSPLQANIDSLQQQVNDLRIDLLHAPGGPVFQQAAESFTNLREQSGV